MSNLETRIAGWRSRMKKAMPQREEAVAELEEHLREHLDSLQQEGRSEVEAFALAQETIGEPRMIGREFDRMSTHWRPGLIILAVLAVFLVLVFGTRLVVPRSWKPISIFRIRTCPKTLFCAFGLT